MPQHPFALQSLLEHRQQLEELRQQELARAQTQLAQAEGLVCLADLAYQASQAALDQERRRIDLDIVALQAGQLRVQRMAAELARTQVARDAAREHCQRVHRAAVAASQERMVLERLSERYAAAAARAADQAEAERLGEMGLARWAAKATS